MAAPPGGLPAAVADAVDALRSIAPLTHCIANFVSMDLAANVLLAAGASPAMVHAAEEAAEFTGISAALCVNIGTLDGPWLASMLACAAAATAAGKPWVLDPVGCGATAFRTKAAADLAALRPTAIRGNGSEVLALAAAVCADGPTGAGGKGVDSTRGSDEAVSAARRLSAATGAVVVVTGSDDFVVDADADVVLAVTSGLPLLQRITATGCSLSALLAAFLGARPVGASRADTRVYAAAACAMFGGAADAAAARLTATGAAVGPGSLRVALLDALYAMRGKDVATIQVVEV
jgi:hydroxyethylthiazole kinase